MTSPKGHVPPSQRSRANKKPALADKHLIVKERLKFMRVGACDPTTNTLFDGEGMYNQLNDDGFIVWPVGISPHGRWGAIFHIHPTGKRWGDYHKFPPSRPEARKCIDVVCPTQHQLKLSR